MFGNDLLHRPQSLLLRKLLFQVHLWVGVGIGAYMFIMGITGSVLVFREELEHRVNPTLYPRLEPGNAPASIVDVIRNIEIAYPQHRITSVYAPTRGRPVYYSFIEKDRRFVTVLASPTGELLGERPNSGFLRWLQDLHVNLLSGTTGRLVNGFAAVLLLVLCVTGALIWWPGLHAWLQNTRVDFRKNWKRVAWELHGATGFWTVLIVAMWAVTGAYFTFPEPFQKVIGKVSPLTMAVAHQSNVSDGRPPIGVNVVIAHSQKLLPDGQVAGVVLPATDRAPLVVQMSRAQPDHMDNTGYVNFTFDQYSGALFEYLGSARSQFR